MVEQQLIDYIRTSQQSGMSFDVIKQDLLSAGWAQTQIDEAYQVINIPKPAVPVPSPNPILTPIVKNPITKKRYTSPFSWMLALVLVVSLLILSQNAVVDILDRFAPRSDRFYSSQEYKNYLKEVDDYKKDKLYNPPRQSDYSYDDPAYNKAYSDWAEQQQIQRQQEETYRLTLFDKYETEYKARGVSPSFRMILHAIVVLPFWILTFLLYFSLKDNRKKFEALLGSYFITSGWLLVFLFFNVASYIYDADTTVGVYIVLGMMIAILTGAVWGIQKYRHNFNQEN